MFPKPRLRCGKDQREVVLDERAALVVAHFRDTLEVEIGADGILRDADRPNLSLDPYVDQRVGSPRAYRIVLHTTPFTPETVDSLVGLPAGRSASGEKVPKPG